MSLLSIAKRLASIDRSDVTFLPERCLHTQNKGAVCTACFEICPANAITAGAPPELDPQKCQGCLACLPACPTGAYSADDAVQATLTSAAAVESTQLELICSLHPHAQQGLSERSAGLVVRGCLAGLGAGTLMALAISEFDQIVCRCDTCSGCPWGALHPLIRAQVAEAQQLLAAWGKSGVPRVCDALENQVDRPVWKAGAPPVSRRAVFHIAARQARVAAARAMVNGEVVQSRRPGRDRMRKINAAFLLDDPVAQAVLPPQAGFVQIYAGDTCTACGACARLCPTEAIRLVIGEDEKHYNLVFYPQYCIDCGFCLRTCAPNALTAGGLPQFKHVFRTQKPVSIQSGSLMRCECCHALVAAQPGAAMNGARLCPMCRFRQANPFGAKLPPGFKPPQTARKDTRR